MPSTCPHGNPIPGHGDARRASSRSRSPRRARARRSWSERITEEAEADKKLLEYLWRYDVRPGRRLTITEVAPWAGTITGRRRTAKPSRSACPPRPRSGCTCPAPAREAATMKLVFWLLVAVVLFYGAYSGMMAVWSYFQINDIVEQAVRERPGLGPEEPGPAGPGGDRQGGCPERARSRRARHRRAVRRRRAHGEGALDLPGDCLQQRDGARHSSLGRPRLRPPVDSASPTSTV